MRECFLWFIIRFRRIQRGPGFQLLGPDVHERRHAGARLLGDLLERQWALHRLCGAHNGWDVLPHVQRWLEVHGDRSLRLPTERCAELAETRHYRL